MVYDDIRVIVHHWGWSEQGREEEFGEKPWRTVACWFALWLVYKLMLSFLEQSRTTCLGMASPTVVLAFPHQ